MITPLWNICRMCVTIITQISIFFFFFISGDLSAATKTKYQTYLKEFENQRGHVETIPALDQNRNNVTLFLKSKFEAAGLTVHLQNFSSTETNTKLVSIVYLVY
jgi:hypothetical protein